MSGRLLQGPRKGGDTLLRMAQGLHRNTFQSC